MRVLVASPFRASWESGQEDLGRSIERAFEENGHVVESIRIPFDREPDELWSQLLAFRLTDVTYAGDLLVATGTPCHLLRHPRKVLWMTDHYPWIGEPSAALESLRAADEQALDEATASFAVSQALCDRIERSCDRAVRLLPPPEQGAWAPVVDTLLGGGARTGVL